MEKRAMLCFLQKTGGARVAFPGVGVRSARVIVRGAACSAWRATARIAFPGLGARSARKKERRSVCNTWRAAARGAFPGAGARSARKKVRWTVFSEGRAEPVLPSPGWGRWPQSGRMRSSPPGIPPLAAEDTPSSLPNLPADACQADDLIRLLASARIHLPQPGEGLRSLPCCTHNNVAVSKTSPMDYSQRMAGAARVPRTWI